MGWVLIEDQQFVIFTIGCTLNYTQLFMFLMTRSSGESMATEQLQLPLCPDNKAQGRNGVFSSYTNNTHS